MAISSENVKFANLPAFSLAEKNTEKGGKYIIRSDVTEVNLRCRRQFSRAFQLWKKRPNILTFSVWERFRFGYTISSENVAPIR